VRRYVELVGGSVACESTVGVGTTFVVELPPVIAAAAAA
jgi:signal transduction histidine kinase